MHLGKNNNNNYQFGSFGWHFGIREINFLRMHFPCLFFRTEAKNHKNEDSTFTFCFSFLLNCVDPLGLHPMTLSLYLSLSFSIIFSIWLLIKSSSLIKKQNITNLLHGNPNRKSPPNESPIVITKSNPQKLEPKPLQRQPTTTQPPRHVQQRQEKYHHTTMPKNHLFNPQEHPQLNQISVTMHGDQVINTNLN